MFLGSIVEVISLGAVLPFLSALNNAQSVMSYPLISDVLAYYDLTKPRQIVLSITIIFIFGIILASITRLLLLYVGTKLSFASGHELSIDLYKRTLSQPYEAQIQRNSSEIITGITTKVSIVTNSLNSSITFLNSLTLIITVSLALVLLNPMIAVLTAISFIIFYAIVTRVVYAKLHKNSSHISSESSQIVKLLQEAMNGIRDIILDSSQNIYSRAFGVRDLKLKNAQSSNIVISATPKFLMESFGMLVISLIALSLYSPENGISNALPLLGALAIGAQRLLPAAQQCFASWSSIAGSSDSIIDILELLDQSDSNESKELDIKPLPFKEVIEFKDVNFKYHINQHDTLSDINISIKKGSKIGFIGSTGSGKSTAVDLLMGLLKPTKGEISIDGLSLKDGNIRNWQKSISHVPQHVFISDATISKNIAFGVSSDDMNNDLLDKVAGEANLLDFIESLPKKYNTIVGELGAFLSGGQAQRIGIARALYKEANILILDEASSSLDSVTEKQIMKSISKPSKGRTIIIITHRLSTIKDCDVIYEFKSGRVVSKGTYNELLKSSTSFQNMTNIN